MTIRRSPGVLMYHFVSRIGVSNTKTIYTAEEYESFTIVVSMSC